MAFLTDRQIEALLQDETRVLTSEIGQSYPITMGKLYWRSYDAMIARRNDVDTESLIWDAEYWSEFYGETVSALFPGCVASQHLNLISRGIDVGLPPPPRPIAAVKRKLQRS